MRVCLQKNCSALANISRKYNGGNVAKAQIDVEAAACEINAHDSPALVELLNNGIFSRQASNLLTNCVPFVVQNRISTLMFSEIVDGDICKESGKNDEENCPRNNRSSSQDGENTCDEETSGEEAISDEENSNEEETHQVFVETAIKFL